MSQILPNKKYELEMPSKKNENLKLFFNFHNIFQKKNLKILTIFKILILF
jgi:hypothetical protein